MVHGNILIYNINLVPFILLILLRELAQDDAHALDLFHVCYKRRSKYWLSVMRDSLGVQL